MKTNNCLSRCKKSFHATEFLHCSVPQKYVEFHTISVKFLSAEFCRIVLHKIGLGKIPKEFAAEFIIQLFCLDSALQRNSVPYFHGISFCIPQFCGIMKNSAEFMTSMGALAVSYALGPW